MVVSREVSSLVSAMRASHDVMGVQPAITFREIWKQEDRRRALLARDDDVPRAWFWL